jgi:hypothetical protein
LILRNHKWLLLTSSLEITSSWRLETRVLSLILSHVLTIWIGKSISVNNGLLLLRILCWVILGGRLDLFFIIILTIAITWKLHLICCVLYLICWFYTNLLWNLILSRLNLRFLLKNIERVFLSLLDLLTHIWWRPSIQRVNVYGLVSALYWCGLVFRRSIFDHINVRLLFAIRWILTNWILIVLVYWSFFTRRFTLIWLFLIRV